MLSNAAMNVRINDAQFLEDVHNEWSDGGINSKTMDLDEWMKGYKYPGCSTPISF